MINPIYSYTRAARELVSIRSGISHAKRASREKQAAAPNNRRKHERENNQTRIPSWWREEGRGTGKCSEVSTGTYPGDAASSPRVSNHGSQVHRDRILRYLKPGYQRIFSRVCLELRPHGPACLLDGYTRPERGSSIVLWQNGYAGACKTSYPGSTPGNTSKRQASSRKLQASSSQSFKLQATSFKRLAARRKLQAASYKL